MRNGVGSADIPQEQNNGNGVYRPSTKHISSLRSSFSQVLATFIQSLLIICLGLSQSVPTLVIAALYKNTSGKFSMNDDEASWYGSIPSIFHLVGSLATGPVQELLGRKGSMLLIYIPYFTAWLTLYYAKTIYALYVVSVLFGLSAGLFEAPLHSYVGEVSEPRLRGALSALSGASRLVGNILIISMAYFTHWTTAVFISCTITVATFLAMTQMPESPTWLIMRNRLDDAQKSLCWLRGWAQPDQVLEEFQSLVKHTKEQLEEGQDVRKDGYFAQFKEIKNEKVFFPLQMVCIIVVISYATAFIGVGPFAIPIMRKVGMKHVELFLIAAIIVGFAGVISQVVLLRHFGKRKMALFAFGLTTIIHLIQASCLSASAGTVSFGWVSITLILACLFLAGLGVMLLPWQLTCEVFPPVGRGTATGIVAAWSHLVSFIMVKSFLYLEAWLTLGGVLYLYSACSALGIFYLYFYLPETEGKTLEEIESYFTKNHDRKKKFSVSPSS